MGVKCHALRGTDVSETLAGRFDHMLLSLLRIWKNDQRHFMPGSAVELRFDPLARIQGDDAISAQCDDEVIAVRGSTRGLGGDRLTSEQIASPKGFRKMTRAAKLPREPLGEVFRAQPAGEIFVDDRDFDLRRIGSRAAFWKFHVVFHSERNCVSAKTVRHQGDDAPHLIPSLMRNQ